MDLPSPEVIAASGAAFGTISHIIRSHEDEGAGLKATFRKWILGRFFNTVGMILGNVAAVAAAPLPEVSGIIQAVALFGVYAGTGAGVNSMVNRPGGSVPAGMGDSQ